MDGRTNYHGLETAFTKRFSNRWQASGTYTLAGLQGRPMPQPLQRVHAGRAASRSPPDLGDEYDLRHRRPASSRRVQRHLGGRPRLPVERAVFLRLRAALRDQLRRRPSRQRRAGRQAACVRTARSSPRNDFVGDPIHRVDMRLQQRIPWLPRCGSTASSRSSTCSTTRTTAPTPPPRATRGTDCRTPTRASCTRLAWCNWDSGPRSERRPT